ncbi:MAG: phosphoenolpyruvate carboxykinase (ATP) [Gemmataceae bacterium]
MAPSFAGSPTPLDLGAIGLSPRRLVAANLSPAALVEAALQRGEGELTDAGALDARTGARTGRSPKDRFIVREKQSEAHIHWGGVNQPIEPAIFDGIRRKVLAHLQERDLFICDGQVCADLAYRVKVRVVAEKAWHALFTRCLYLRPTPLDLLTFEPDWHVLAAPELRLDPARDGSRSDCFIGICFAHKLVVVAGTHYAGELKKSIFSILNYLLPLQGVLSMHCAANVGPADDVALFFGLSGTGKTTLSADPHRRLIGDDEHGWSETGVFNVEGGCYAKTIRLSKEGEPQIWNAIRFGSVLENVPLDPLTRTPDFEDGRMTENTRAAYPIDFIPNCELSGRGGHPKNIFFLTCDAFGVLPPLARLTPEQAMYHFLCGYTAKVAGTEAGVTEPEATFSTCFAAPFLPLHPTRYAEMLRQKMEQHRCPVWLVNTGWTGGPYGKGRRMSLTHTRALLRSALTGTLENAAYDPDPVFGLRVPHECPDVPVEVLQPRKTWPNPAAYDAQARKLATLFREKFAAFADKTTDAVRNAGPKG